VITDLLVITFLFTLDPQYHVFVLEVLWAIGCGMILLSLLIHGRGRAGGGVCRAFACLSESWDICA
jgi:uncharacterized membrane protein